MHYPKEGRRIRLHKNGKLPPVHRRDCFLVDLDARFRRVEYDVERTQREMRDAGLPEMLAGRLELGI